MPSEKQRSKRQNAEMADFILWLTLLTNAAFSVAMAMRYRHLMVTNRLDEASAKRRFSAWAIVGSALCGLVIYAVLIELLKVPLAHGEGLGGPIYNFLLVGVLVTAGRIVIGWVPMRL